MATGDITTNEQDARTVAMKACRDCSRQLLESDRFCRWCGQSQPSPGNIPGPSVELAVAAKYSTSLLEDPRRNLYHRVSGPLVSAAVAGVSRGDLSELSSGGWMRRMILALIAVPIWLMIVLLSPLDAYAAAKNLVRQNR